MDNVLPDGRCRRCPFCAPSGQCLDPAIKSGRCGDWVWYMRGNKQCRRRWTKPRDPRTPQQLHWRARLGAASQRYSQSLTDEQQDACIAAGAKLRSRPRLGQWGWLTGQQYWVRRECTGKAEGRMQNAGTGGQVLQPQTVSPSTWETHRSISGLPPGHRRRRTRSTWEQYHSGSVAVPWQCRRTTAHSGRLVRIWRIRGRCSAAESCRNGCWRELWRGS